MTSYKQGADDIVKRLKQKDTECPNQKFALVGYSQGAMATHTAMSQLPAKIQDKILAVVMYGDMGMATGFPDKLKERALENCAGGDFVSSCSNKISFVCFVLTTLF
jgi:cutinase